MISAWFLPPVFVLGYGVATWQSRSEFNAMTRIAGRALAICENLYATGADAAPRADTRPEPPDA